MLSITARLAAQCPQPTMAPYKATISVHYPKHRAISVKPCFYSPGRCAVQHTTISLASPQPGEPIGFTGRVGHSGLSLLHGEVLYCSRHTCSGGNCSQYVALKRPDRLPSVAALCIPLKPGIRDVIRAFMDGGAEGAVAAGVIACRAGSGSCDCSNDAVGRLIESKGGQKIESVAVLNLECATDDLSFARARGILEDEAIVSLLEQVTVSVEGYSRDREKYKVLKTCTSLFDLSQHNLSIRETYRALMREVSEMCDGADVTLHLRDLDKSKDEEKPNDDDSRCINLVTGIGKNFRGFLVNERYGLQDGLVGSVLSRRESDYVTKDQIDEALATHEPSKPFKQLMPRSCLNLAVPLAFQEFVFGVLNIEWDETCLAGQDASEYIKKRRPLIERVAAYLAQVIDYYEDRENPAFRPPPADQEAHSRREEVQRQRIAYYVQQAIDDLDKEVDEESSLKKLINAVGYLVGFDNDLRIMVSLRKLVVVNDLELLRLIADHGVPRFIGEGDEESLSIISAYPSAREARSHLLVEVGTSVLGTCAKLGVPLFGEVIGRSTFKPDVLCLELLREKERDLLKEEEDIRYAPCGRPEPRYEVALPLVFGGKTIGTLDFELFAADEKKTRHAGSSADLRLKAHELPGFLDWARAAAFCMAYSEDKSLGRLLDQQKKESLSRFQTLCAQAIANIRLPGKQAEKIAEQYFHELIPFEGLSVEPFDWAASYIAQTSPSSDEQPRESRTALRFRGRPLGELRLNRGSNSDPSPRSLFPEHRGEGPGGTVKRLMASYFISNLLTVRHEREESRELVESFQRIQHRLELKISEEKFSGPSVHAGGVITSVFDLLKEALADEFNSSKKEASRYAWFLYLARLDPQDDCTTLCCGTPWHRWAGADTEDMKARIEEACNDSKEGLKNILLRAERTEDILRFLERAAQFPRNPEKLKEVFIEVLADKDHPVAGGALEIDHEGDELSFTRHVAASREIQSSINFNMSPHRSPFDTSWFYTRPYSIVGLPIVLGDRSIGVLNVLRRRDTGDDFLFFSNEELSAANALKVFIAELFMRFVDYRSLPELTGYISLSDLPSRRELTQQLMQALANGQRIIGVECNFADSADQIRELLQGSEERFFLFTEHDRWDDLKMGLKDEDRVVVLAASGIPPAQRERHLSEALQLCWKLVIFFSTKEEESPLLASLPDRPFALVESAEELEQHVLNCFSVAWRNAGQKSLGKAVLFRKGDVAKKGESKWSIADMIEHLGCDASGIANGVPSLLRQHVRDGWIWRGYSDWMVYSYADSKEVARQPLKVFVSYAHEDRRLKEELVTHLTPARIVGMTTWNDDELKGGDLWMEKITDQLETCNMAVLLVSASFLDSGFCQKKEVPFLVRRGVPIIPIILRACNWELDPVISRLVALPRDKRPVMGLPRARRDESFRQIVLELLNIHLRPTASSSNNSD